MHWVYKFIKIRPLSVRTRTRKSQITNTIMQSVKQDSCRRLMTSNNGLIRNPPFFVYMDERTVYLNCSPNRTVHTRGQKSVSIMVGGTSSTRFTLTATIAMYGTKLPLFPIFKGKRRGSIEKSLPEIIPEDVIGCILLKGRIDSRTIAIWYDNIYKPYIAGMMGILADT